MFMRNVSHVHKNRHQKNAVNKKINQKNGREPDNGFLLFLLPGHLEYLACSETEVWCCLWRLCLRAT